MIAIPFPRGPLQIMEHTGRIFLHLDQYGCIVRLRKIGPTFCCCARIGELWFSVLYTRGAEEPMPENREVANTADSRS